MNTPSIGDWVELDTKHKNSIVDNRRGNKISKIEKVGF
jgi:hypothetical protein